MDKRDRGVPARGTIAGLALANLPNFHGHSLPSHRMSVRHRPIPPRSTRKYMTWAVRRTDSNPIPTCVPARDTIAGLALANLPNFHGHSLLSLILSLRYRPFPPRSARQSMTHADLRTDSYSIPPSVTARDPIEGLALANLPTFHGQSLSSLIHI